MFCLKFRVLIHILLFFVRKRWHLFPPEDTPFLYPTRIPYEESSVFSKINVINPDLKRFPRFQKARRHVVTLSPGQVMWAVKPWGPVQGHPSYNFSQVVMPQVSPFPPLPPALQIRTDSSPRALLLEGSFSTYRLHKHTSLLLRSWKDGSQEHSSLYW